MALDISDISSFTVPSTLILVYKDGSDIKGKKSDNSIVDLTADDVLRLDVNTDDLPMFVVAADYESSHAKSAINNLTTRSAFEQSAAANYTKMVAGQKVAKGTFYTKMYEVSQALGTEEARAEAAEAAVDAKINFGEMVNRIWIYGSNIFDLNKMVKVGAYYCSTDANTVGTAMTNMPSFNDTTCSEGVLIVAKNTQIFIEGGTAKGRLFYRYQTGAGPSVTEYTEAWTPMAKFSDVSALDTSINDLIGTVPTGSTVMSEIAGVNTALETLRTAVEGISGSNAIEVTGDSSDAAKKAISLKLDGTSLSQGANGLKSELKVAQQATAEDGYAATYFLTDAGGTNVYGAKINIIKDQFLKSQPEIYTASADSAPSGWLGDTYVKGNKYLKFVWQLTREEGSVDSDDDHITYLDVNSMFDSYTSGSGAIVVDQNGNTIALKIDDNSEKVTTAADTTAAVLSQGDAGLKVSNIQTAINYAVNTEKTRAETAEGTLQSAVDTEASARETAISTEASTREEADASLQANIDNGLALKTTTLLTDSDGNKSYIFNELDGGGAKIERNVSSGIKNVFVGVKLSDGDRTENHALASIYALDADSVGTRFTVFNDMITYKANAAKADRNDSAYELAVKDDVATAKSEVLLETLHIDGSNEMTADLPLRMVGGQAPGSTAMVLIGGTPDASTPASSTISFKTKYGMGTEIVSNLTPDGSIVLTQTVADARYIQEVEEDHASEIIVAKDDGDVEVSGYKAGSSTLSTVQAIRSTATGNDVVNNVTYTRVNEAVTAVIDSEQRTLYKWTSSNGDAYTLSQTPAVGDAIYYLTYNEQLGGYSVNSDYTGVLVAFSGLAYSNTTLATEAAVSAKADAVASTAASNLSTHAALNTRHTAEVKFIRTVTGTTSAKEELDYHQYICKATLIGELPSAPSDGTKVIVTVVSGGEGTVIYPASGDKISSSTEPVAINVSNDTVTFVYDAVNGDWLVL